MITFLDDLHPASTFSQYDHNQKNSHPDMGEDRHDFFF